MSAVVVWFHLTVKAYPKINHLMVYFSSGHFFFIGQFNLGHQLFVIDNLLKQNFTALESCTIAVSCPDVNCII